MTLREMIQDAVNEIKRRHPGRYSDDEYTTPARQFKIIQDELHRMGIANAITSYQYEKKLVSRMRFTPSQYNAIVYAYRFQVVLNYNTVKVYKSSNSAKYRVLKEYLKHKVNEKKTA